MRSGLVRSSRALALGVVAIALSAAPTLAATQVADVTIARTGVFVSADLPAGFTVASDPQKTQAEKIRLAKGVAGCSPFIAFQKAVAPLPQARSPRFVAGSRSIANEIEVFPGARAASAALAQTAKSSTVGCLENLYEKQARQDPDLRSVLADVVVSLDRQDIVGLGDDSVVYEGNVVLTGKDGSTKQIGVGTAAVRVDRVVTVVTYSTDGEALTEILAPALDASVARLRAALGRSPS